MEQLLQAELLSSNYQFVCECVREREREREEDSEGGREEYIQKFEVMGSLCMHWWSDINTTLRPHKVTITNLIIIFQAKLIKHLLNNYITVDKKTQWNWT